jgi:carbon monoxide dehydrogenase subunit G
VALYLTLHEEIAAPPERVLAALTDLDHSGRWMPRFVRIERLTGAGFGVGTQVRLTRKLFGREMTEHFEVQKYEPGRVLELFIDGAKGDSKRGYYRFRYELTPAGPETRVTMTGEIGGMGRVMELIGRLFVGPLKKAIAKDLSAMKSYIEKEG